MKFDPYVIPFCAGFLIMLSTLFILYFQWIYSLDKKDKRLILKGVFSFKIFGVIKEILLEALLHVRIFKKNFLLGYMHMSFAFGWFLLIVFGAIEVRMYNKEMVMLYEAIFLKFFYPDITGIRYQPFFHFIMDLLLAFILLGLILAMLKRVHAKWFGIKKSSTQLNYDRFALTVLWLIFPLRLLAESLTVGIYGNGSFLTGTIGSWFSNSGINLTNVAYIAWWAYSIDLGIFFVILPFSRYMHIPTEIVLIALRRFGLKTIDRFTGYTSIEVNACSNCGICTNSCPLNIVLKKKETVFPYFARSIRNSKADEKQAYTCLLCGQCKIVCPVNIDTTAIRSIKRENFFREQKNVFAYIQPSKAEQAKTAYFAGCMTHLTPSVKKAMHTIFQKSGTDFTLLDKDHSICCGRPLMLSGNREQAIELIAKNKALIAASGASRLVLSCPVCYKTFKEDYELDIEVLHHTEFIHSLVENEKVKLQPTNQSFSYHDPCELGRGSSVYEAPRYLIKSIGTLKESSNNKENSICCGGSLGDLKLQYDERKLITRNSLASLTVHEPDCIITACPLCKKTFSALSEIKVTDIAEIISKNIIN